MIDAPKRCEVCGARNPTFSHHEDVPVPKGGKLVTRSMAVYVCRQGHKTLVEAEQA
jgi:hypothetical protein